MSNKNIDKEIVQWNDKLKAKTGELEKLQSEKIRNDFRTISRRAEKSEIKSIEVSKKDKRSNSVFR